MERPTSPDPIIRMAIQGKDEGESAADSPRITGEIRSSWPRLSRLDWDSLVSVKTGRGVDEDFGVVVILGFGVADGLGVDEGGT